MHDPLSVAFEVPNPFARRYPRAARWRERPALLVVWHGDPEARGGDGPWRRHVRHWRLQVPLVQGLKRWLFSRCCRCGGRFPFGYAPASFARGGPGPRWFRGEPDVYHHDCAGAAGPGAD
jgi:hypothetical protein